LVLLAIFIIITFDAEIIKISNQIAYKTRIESDNDIKTYQAGLHREIDDIFCYSYRGFKISCLFPQETRLISYDFSNQGVLLATHFYKTKGLIFQSKIALTRAMILLKYRFFMYKESLEGYQAKIVNETKLSQNKDSLSMLRGLVLGEKDTNNSYYSSFARAGMIHILVASGFNISLLAGYFNKILILLPRKIRYYGLLIIVWSYTWFLGGEAPLLRASLMMTTSLFLLEKGVRTHSRRILFSSAVIILILNPSLIESLSFWFSFLATLGLVLFHNRFLLFSSSSNGFLSFFKTEFFSSLSAQLLILPLVINFFNEINWLGFITNSIFLFPVAGFTQVGFGLLILFGMFGSRLLYPFSLIYRSILLIFIFIIGQTKRLFFLQHFISSEEKDWFLLCWALCLMLIIALLRGKKAKKGLFFHESV